MKKTNLRIFKHIYFSLEAKLQSNIRRDFPTLQQPTEEKKLDLRIISEENFDLKVDQRDLMLFDERAQ